MLKRLVWVWIYVAGALALLAACSAQQRGALRELAPPPVAARITPVPRPSESPAFSELQTPTPRPTMAGPMGTLTAIADLVALPTQNPEPYVIVKRGLPHFIEFHAWW